MKANLEIREGGFRSLLKTWKLKCQITDEGRDASAASNNLYPLQSSIKAEQFHFFFQIPIPLRNLHLPVSFHEERMGYKTVIAYLRKSLIELSCLEFVFDP